MTHATAEEIHDHAYGFRPSDHIAGCAGCARAADAVAAEREALRNVLEDEDVPEAPGELLVRLAAAKPARARIAAPALAAAALLLAALAWLLFQPKAPERAAVASQAPPTQQAEIDRLIAELRSPSPERREAAATALKAYGGIAVEPLKKAGADLRLIDECRDIPIEDQNVIVKMKQTRVRVEWKETPLADAIDQLRESSGLSFHVTEVDAQMKVSLKLPDASTFDCLELLREKSGIPYSVRQTIVLVGRALPEPASWAPLRLPPMIAEARKLSAPLSGGTPEEQDRAAKALLKLGFSGEPVLWELLDSSDAGVKRRAADLLRQLYRRPAPSARVGPPPPLDPNAPAVVRLLEGTTQTIDFVNATSLDILGYLSKNLGLTILIDPRVDLGLQPVTFKSKDLALKNVLKLLLSQFSLDYAVGDGWVMVVAPGRAELPRPIGPLWLTPEEAKAAQNLLLDFASTDAARREKARRSILEAGRPALAWLAQASDVSSSAEAARFGALRRELAESLKVWLIDARSGVDLQDLTRAQTAILDRPLPAGQQGLEKLPVVLKIPGPFRVSGVTAPGLSCGAYLKAITRVQGMDLYMAGNDIVIDTAANVRAVVEK